MTEPRNAEASALDALMETVLPKGELPPPPRHVAAIFYEAGAASRQGEVDRLLRVLDRAHDAYAAMLGSQLRREKIQSELWEAIEAVFDLLPEAHALRHSR